MSDSAVKLRSAIARIVEHEDLNFLLLTNRIPRRWLTIFLGWFSKLENPLIRSGSLLIWRMFSDLDLSEAKKTHFKSLHDCFTRELKEGARPIDLDPTALVSPCDAIVGASGTIADGSLLQAKGFPYTLESLLGANQRELTRRLSRRHLRDPAPHLEHVSPFPCAVRLQRGTGQLHLGRYVERQPHCASSGSSNCSARTSVPSSVAGYPSSQMLTLVPVAAILVASIRLHFLDVLLHLKYRGPNVMKCDAKFRKGEEMGWFQHGSTIIVLAPPGVTIRSDIVQGQRIRMGQPLFRLPD